MAPPSPEGKRGQLCSPEPAVLLRESPESSRPNEHCGKGRIYLIPLLFPALPKCPTHSRCLIGFTGVLRAFSEFSPELTTYVADRWLPVGRGDVPKKRCL